MKKNRSGHQSSIQNIIQIFDIFGKTVGFNIDKFGNDKKKTFCGGVATIFLGLFALMFMVTNLEKIRDPDFS